MITWRIGIDGECYYGGWRRIFCLLLTSGGCVDGFLRFIRRRVIRGGFSKLGDLPKKKASCDNRTSAEWDGSLWLGHDTHLIEDFYRIWLLFSTILAYMGSIPHSFKSHESGFRFAPCSLLSALLVIGSDLSLMARSLALRQHTTFSIYKDSDRIFATLLFYSSCTSTNPPFRLWVWDICLSEELETAVYWVAIEIMLLGTLFTLPPSSPLCTSIFSASCVFIDRM